MIFARGSILDQFKSFSPVWLSGKGSRLHPVHKHFNGPRLVFNFHFTKVRSNIVLAVILCLEFRLFLVLSYFSLVNSLDKTLASVGVWVESWQGFKPITCRPVTRDLEVALVLSLSRMPSLREPTLLFK